MWRRTGAMSTSRAPRGTVLHVIWKDDTVAQPANYDVFHRSSVDGGTNFGAIKPGGHRAGGVRHRRCRGAEGLRRLERSEWRGPHPAIRQRRREFLPPRSASRPSAARPSSPRSLHRPGSMSAGMTERSATASCSIASVRLREAATGPCGRWRLGALPTLVPGSLASCAGRGRRAGESAPVPRAGLRPARGAGLARPALSFAAARNPARGTAADSHPGPRPARRYKRASAMRRQPTLGSRASNADSA